MTRLARVVAPGYPHHITQRGNRRQPTFFEENDYKLYLSLLQEQCSRTGVNVWAYCLMPNHVHLIVVPETEDGLRRAIGETHRRFTRAINKRMEWRGYLWQGRFASFPMDETYLLTAVRYIELNPVKAGLVDEPEQYVWSSARFHMDLNDDPLLAGSPLRDMVGDWRAFLDITDDENVRRKIRLSSSTGRPLGSDKFTDTLESQLDRTLHPQRRGPKVK